MARVIKFCDGSDILIRGKQGMLASLGTDQVGGRDFSIGFDAEQTEGQVHLLRLATEGFEVVA